LAKTTTRLQYFLPLKNKKKQHKRENICKKCDKIKDRFYPKRQRFCIVFCPQKVKNNGINKKICAKNGIISKSAFGKNDNVG